MTGKKCIRRISLVENLESRKLLAAILSDQTVNGQISANGGVDEYTISLTAGNSIFAVVGETTTTALSPRIQLIAPDGSTLGDSSNAFGANVSEANVTQSGVYKVLISDLESNNVGSYSVTVGKVPGAQSANDSNGGTITSGERKIGEMPAGDLDVYQMQITQGDSVVVSFAETNNSYYPDLTAFGPDGSIVTSSWHHHGFQLRFVAAATGVYNFVAWDHYGYYIGNYAITAFRSTGTIADDTTDSDPLTIQSGQRVLGSISEGDSDAMTFSVSQGDTVVLSLAETSNSFYPELLVFGPDGSAVDSNWADNGFNLSFTAAATGSYRYVILDHYGTYLGDYAISTFKSTGAIVDDATDNDPPTILNGQRIRGALALGDSDVTTMQINQSDNVVLSLADATGTMYPELTVFGPDGTVVETTWADPGFIITFTAAASGNYRLLAHDHYGYYVGHYALSAFKSTGAISDDYSDDDLATIENGVRKLGDIAFGDSDAMRFSATQGDEVLINVSDATGTFYPEFTVYGPDGSSIDSLWGDPGGRIEFTAGATGNYTIVIYDHYGYYAGQYSATVFKSTGAIAADPNDIDSGNLASTTTLNGSVTAGDLDAFRVNATSGQPMTIRLNEIHSGGYPELAVYRPNGELVNVAWGVGSAELTFTPNSTGAHTIVVSDHYGYYSFGYGLSVNSAATTTDTTAPQVLSAYFDYNKPNHPLMIYFSEAITGLTVADLAVLNTTTNIQVSSLNIAFSNATNVATITFPNLPNGRLNEGNYRLTVNSGGVQDAAGLNSSNGLTYNFHVLLGDLNRDRKVDFNDLLIMAQNYGTLGRIFSYGNVNYSSDGAVNFEDLLPLAQRYGTQLPQPIMHAGSGDDTTTDLFRHDSLDEILG